MTNPVIKCFAVSVLLGGTVCGTANAGGFSRGSADLDLLYGSEVGINSGVAIVVPGRRFDSVNGAAPVFRPPSPVITPLSEEGGEFANDYVVPYFSAGGRIGGDVNCVASYAEPYGASSSYPDSVAFYDTEVSLDTEEYGLTCSYGIDLSKGRAYVIGGIFYETLEYRKGRNFNAAFPPSFFGYESGDSRIVVDSSDVGFRVGAAYEIEEIALRASLLYRSETTHDFSGQFFNTPFQTLFGARALAAAAAGDFALAAQLGQLAAQSAGITSASAYGSATLPQSVELKVQSGFAPGWLAFGVVKWTDWSVLEDVDIFEGNFNTPFTNDEFFFEDGWTVTGGVGRRFNEKVAGSLSLTWDQGVTSGYDTLTDTYTLAAGTAISVTEEVDIKFGGAAIYLTEGEQTRGDYNATSPGEWGYALSFATSIRF